MFRTHPLQNPLAQPPLSPSALLFYLNALKHTLNDLQAHIKTSHIEFDPRICVHPNLSCNLFLFIYLFVFSKVDLCQNRPEIT